MRQLISRLLPIPLKNKILQSDCLINKDARRLAKSSKRLDLCAAQFANVLHLSEISSIEGKVCLEIGGGWVLTHAVVCYLLGAKKVIVTDVMPYARPETLSCAIKNSIDSIPRDMLAPFSGHSLIRERYNKLLSISVYNFDALSELGIEYRSPIDFAVDKIDTPIDFIYSFSVLEHVPKDDIKGLLNNLIDSLSANGVMIHSIHLEDHRSIGEYPFEFLSRPANEYTRKEQTQRGNRIRFSEWNTIFASL
jgi:hypothetical protein